jgi:hypothetical protein
VEPQVHAVGGNGLCDPAAWPPEGAETDTAIADVALCAISQLFEADSDKAAAAESLCVIWYPS